MISTVGGQRFYCFRFVRVRLNCQLIYLRIHILHDLLRTPLVLLECFPL